MEDVKEVTSINTVGFEDPKGAFFDSLVRSNSKIKKDRAASIHEAAAILYKREVEDTQIQIRQLRRDRESMLDLSPENVTSLKLASDFDAKEFVAKDIEIGIKLRNLEIKLEIAQTRYNYLFSEGV